MRSILIILSVILISQGCKPKLEGEEFNPGGADFTKVIAVGDEALSGYMDAGLTRDGQENALGNIIALQMAKADAGTFNQPLLPTGSGTGYLLLNSYTSPTDFECNFEVSNSAILSNVNLSAPLCSDTDAFVATYKRFIEPNNNWSAPFLSIQDLQTSGLGFNNSTYFNPFYERMIASTDMNSYTETVYQQNASFFICSIGLADVINYAKSKSSCVAIKSDIDISVSDYEPYYRALLDTLTSNGAKGVVATLPYLYQLPYYNFHSDADTIYVERKGQLYNEFKIEPMTAKDMISIDAIKNLGTVDDSGNAYGYHIDNPILSADAIDERERLFIEILTDKINFNVIEPLANEYDLALVDMTNMFAPVIDETTSKENRITINGVHYSTDFIEGGVISIDGLHFNARGNAIVANKYIKTINNHYGAHIPMVDVNSYKGIIYP